MPSILTITAYIGTVYATGNPATPMIDAAILLLLVLAGAMALMLMVETSRENARMHKLEAYVDRARQRRNDWY